MKDLKSEKTIFSKLALGTVQFGIPYGIANSKGQVNLKNATKIIELARSKGINTLDTAITYGESESVLGEIGVSDFLVLTKLPHPPQDIKNVGLWVRESVYKSLEKLKIARLEGLLLHRPDLLQSSFKDELIVVIDALKSEKVINKFGISIYSPSEIDLNLTKSIIDIIQTPMNIIDRTILQTGLLNILKKQEVEIHIRSIFLQGLLLLGANERPKKFNRWHYIWSEYDLWLEKNKISKLFACLSFVKAVCEIDKIIFGVDDVAHLNEILSNYELEEKIVFPESISSKDEDLIHPSNWSKF